VSAADRTGTNAAGDIKNAPAVSAKKHRKTNMKAKS